MKKAAEVTVEFYGIPRHRAGRAEVVVQATVMADLLAAVKRVCPGLADLTDQAGRLAPHYLLSIDGVDFTKDITRSVEPGMRIMLLTADAGG
jgi:hypothetical protein